MEFLGVIFARETVFAIACVLLFQDDFLDRSVGGITVRRRTVVKRVVPQSVEVVTLVVVISHVASGIVGASDLHLIQGEH